MTVKLSSLRVTAEMDVAQYIRAAADKQAADKGMIATSQQVGQALAAQDAAAAKAVPGVSSLSRQYIDGYGQAAKFEAAVRSVGTALDRGMDPARAAAALDGIYRKFGQVADAAKIAVTGFKSLVPVISAVNEQYAAMAAAQDRAAAASARLAQMQEFQSTLNTRLMGDPLGGATIAYGDAKRSGKVFSDDLDAKDSAQRAAMMQAEMDRMNEIARLKAIQIAQNFAQDLEALLVAGTGKSVRESAVEFEAEMDRLDTIARAKAEQIAQTTQLAFAEFYGIDTPSKSAPQSGAVFSDEMDRMDDIARLKAIQIGQNFARDLEALLVAGTGKSVRESAVEFETEMDRLDTIARAKAEQIAQTTQLAFNEFYGIDRPRKSAPQSGAVFSEDIAMQDDLDRRRKAIMDTHLPMEVEMQRTKDIQKEINFLGRQELLTQEQVNDALKAENLRHAQSRRSIEGMTVSQGKYASGVGLARNEVVNLSRQLQDVAVTLQMGQPLSTILMQQGTQIADIFASSNATFGGFVRQVGTGARFVATSFAGIAAGALAIGAGLSFAGLRFADGQREVERQLGGIGRASGATVQDINSVADALSRQQQISRGAAREIAGTFAATGMIRPNEIAGLSGMTRDFAAQTGQTDLAAAAKELAAAYADPAKGADTLNQKLGFLDARTRDYIRTLQDQNNRSEASIVLQKAMAESVSGAADRVSWLTRAWQGLRDAVANTIDSIGQAVAGEITLEQKLAQAIQQRSQLQAASGGWAARMGQVGQRTAAIDREIAAIQSQIAAEKQIQEERARTARESAASITADNLIEKVFPDLSRIRELRAAVVDLDAALSNPGVRSRLADVSEAQRAQEAFRNAVETSLTSAQRLTAEGDLAVKGIMARTLEEQKSVALERERLALAGQTVDKVDAELRLRNTMLQVQSNAAREARDALRSANDNAELAGLRPYQRAVREQEMRMRDLRERTEGGNIVPFTRGGQRDSNIAVTSAPAGMNADFAARVRALIAAVGDGGAVMTSGFRTREKQQELYDRYGPGRAAVPGTSQHEKGTAADYVFSTPEARRRALEMASQHGLRALPSNRGAVHFDMGRAGALAGGPAAGQSLDAYTAAANRGTEAANRFARQQQFVLVPLREVEDDLKKQTEVLALQEQAFSRSAFEIGRAAKEQELLSRFQQQGVELTDSLRQSVAQLADDYGRLAERQISGKLSQDALFEREQLGRSDIDRGIASRLFGTGIGMDSKEASALRFNAALGQTQDLLSGITFDLLSSTAKGGNFFDLLRNGAIRLTDQLMQMATNALIRNLFTMLTNGIGSSGGGGIGGFFGSLLGFGGGGPGPPMRLPGSVNANGNIFSGGNVIPFAKGGVVSAPTLFPMSGGRTGLMGEAGEEAIIPLRRGPGGSLGVQSYGRQSQAAQRTELNVNINLAGANGDETIRQIASQASLEGVKIAVSHMKRELPIALAEIQRRG